MTVTKNTTEVTAIEYKGDMFATSEYDEVSNRVARIQCLRGETDPKGFGFFITESDLAKVGYNYNIEDLVEYQYNTGGVENGLLIQSPRMLIAQKTGLMAKKEVESDGVTYSVYEAYDTNLHADRTVYKPCTGYDILLLDKDNNLLHESPLFYTAKGSNGASFNAELTKYFNEMVALHAKLNKVPKRNKDWRFKSLCVFVPALARELAGDKAKSFACKFVGYQSPTATTFKDLFIGIDYDKAQEVWSILNPVQTKEFIVLGQLAPQSSEITVVRQDEVYLAQFVGRFAEIFGSDRKEVESYCQAKYGVGLQGMSNNQLLNAIDVLNSPNF
jgi:Family of unknown function (DUF5895)